MRMLIISSLIMLTVLSSCTSSQSRLAINDYFGIRMAEEDGPNFEIVSYSAEDGVKYHSSIMMNPNLFAWAEISGKKVHIKVVNNLEQEIPSSWVGDEFTVETEDGKIFRLDKGQNTNYPASGVIMPNTEMEFFLKFPAKFWDTIGARNQRSHEDSYLEEFWTGMDTNTNALSRKKIKMISITLGSRYHIILKRVPEKVIAKN